MSRLRTIDVAVALCRAYNDWAHDYCSASPQRLKAPVLLPQLDVHEATLELRRGTRELGAKAAMLRPNPVGERSSLDAKRRVMERFAESILVPMRAS